MRRLRPVGTGGVRRSEHPSEDISCIYEVAPIFATVILHFLSLLKMQPGPPKGRRCCTVTVA